MKRIIMVSISLLMMSLFLGSVLWGEKDPYKQYAGFLNINTATYEQLILLPDMTEDVARNIIAYREANGPFSSMDELIKVRGFWYTYIDQLRPYVRLEGENTLREVNP
jgi:competence protein ComEA